MPEQPAERNAAYPLPAPRAPIPTPWPQLTAALDLVFRHKAGLITQDGTAEARAGQDIALHCAAYGINTLLFTTTPPATAPPALAIETREHPTPDYINNRLLSPARGQQPQLVVIERYERLRPDPRHIPAQYDPIDDLDYEPPTAAEDLLQSVRDIRIEVPLLLTTTVSPQPQMTDPLDRWLHHDHPAVTLTDVCKPVLLVHRTADQTVEGRLEINPQGASGTRLTIEWPATQAAPK
ncbi:hypothetical protein [Streptomyces sp. YS415]|uniref:hypothetical protein n=1 Tax=Streptomyces sp. YS415 TaxID=2944806 RepID=UPI0020204F47|nr:hypothetical protein [Streptomyces sp. YS415]MCL7430154.1 hypothetical protein [Streptomyces sp. YS415]